MTPVILQRLTQALGLGTLVFGVVPFISPRRFASLAGFASPDHPTDEATSRSVGARDIALGVGILTAASGPASPTQSTQLAPWLLARLLCDAGDTTALALAIHRGARNPRILTLLALALAATTYSTTLLTLMRGFRPGVQGAKPPVDSKGRNR